VTPDYLASTPRVVKEATALAQAGYAVRVVHARGGLARWRTFDSELTLPPGVQRSVIGWSQSEPGERSLYQRSRWRHRLWRAAPTFLRDVPGVAERVLGRLYPELWRMAADQVADLYIGHYPAGLAAAATAALQHQTLLGFDSEDLHAQEGLPVQSSTRTWVAALEARLLPRCVHLSAASELIAEALRASYGCPLPVTVRNTFPEPSACTAAPTRERQDQGLALYWFSQTIGAGRGLEWTIAALARVRGDVHLYLRGEISNSERARLVAIATQHGCTGRVHFLQPVRPEQLHVCSQAFDIGLALELSESPSRDLTVTNKLYQYLQAGLASIASDTAGQSAVLRQIGMDSCVVRQQDVAELARAVQELLDDPAKLALVRAQARAAASGALAHTHDQHALVQSVRHALAQNRP
jgi:glycosyltransferase involved in cell wall biosynthesis